ncbi:beta-ketoacyl-[acyl-carrier-protein] synthase family protein [Rubellicoccus peritrichatus]|uniref:3-oxoacyl-[acyl-carrier-protein] synthase 1 n=1 Tax=Rubellicoccus peritrichatus TaxID=3080537 RepID=A0AAQ3LEH4_9BACT|nr:beta-ketoacyl-[acyl-carrier-protein] synthase family protein [Puniceicoccus sp. CR14]WOO42148.1 beta-ketoacyl-[acyl-carrier-protein] synthase family protein [Puniceicoccus sp. CR14]
MPEVVITGLGFVTSIGNDQKVVLDSLMNLRHGIDYFPDFGEETSPVKVAGTIKDFSAKGCDPEDWTFPDRYSIKRDILRSLPPHGLYAYCATTQAIEDAGLTADEVSGLDTGLFTASAGSAKMLHNHVERMNRSGVMRCSPLGIVNSVVGTLTFNLAAAFSIKGASAGFVSACASSGHALGYAWDEIMLGRQKRMIVVGGEDGNRESILPFAGMRALSQSSDPESASRPFDKDRDGFVGTGGSVVMILEDAEVAKARGAKVYAQMAGWGQASDGYNVAISHPDGDGLANAMRRAAAHAKISLQEIDYINAHAPSTPIGDLSEIRALKQTFGDRSPAISSTKALTGHGLSLASIMEAAFTVLGVNDRFMPGSAHIMSLDPEAKDLHIIKETEDEGPKFAMSNSSGFGGANVSLIFKRN